MRRIILTEDSSYGKKNNEVMLRNEVADMLCFQSKAKYVMKVVNNTKKYNKGDILHIDFHNDEDIKDDVIKGNIIFQECFDTDKLDIEYKQFKLRYETAHLPKFDILYKGVSLFGGDYTKVAKAQYYSLIGSAIKTDTYTTFGTVKTDTRVNLLYILNSGHGKSNIKSVNTECTPTEYTTTEISSLHPEQLIGKRVNNPKYKAPPKEEEEDTRQENEKEEKIDNKGVFGDDVVIFDEARVLLTSSEESKREIRKYFCQALDTTGQNLIQKRLVNDLPENRLSYYPNCTAIFMTQPVTIINDVLASGFIRRFKMIEIEKSNKPLNVYKERAKKEHNPDVYLEQFKQHINNIKQKSLTFNSINNCNDDIPQQKQEWTFDEDVFTLIPKYSEMLRQMSIEHSKKGFDYVDKIYEQTIMNDMIKFSMISAFIQKQEKKVTKEDVELAYMDLFEILYSTLNCIAQHGQEVYTHNLNDDDKWILQHLYNRHSLNIEDTEKYPLIKIRELINDIEREFELSFSGARHRYRKLKQAGYIDSKQENKHNSEVWLTEKGIKAIIKKPIINNDFTKLPYYEEYIKICDKIKGVKENTVLTGVACKNV